MQTLPTLFSKLPSVGTTIFTIMSALAQKHQAINLSQGFPDFQPHPKLIELVSKYLKEGFNQYAYMAGMPQMREQIVEKIKLTYQTKVNEDEEVTVTAGASEALFCAISTLVRKGDEVIYFEPGYDLYQPIIELNGGKAIPIPLKAEDYAVDWELVKTKFNENTKAIIINTPHNPSGRIWQKADIKQLQKLVQNSNVFLISDEVYEHIIFDEYLHESLLRYPDLKARSFVISSFGKTFHITGWKVGYCIAPQALTKEFRKIHQYNTFCIPPAFQLGIADFLQDPTHYLELATFYQERRDTFQQLISETPFELLPCEGTYFQLVSYKKMSQEGEVDYAQRLTREVGVASIPLSPFYAKKQENQVLRFCFAKNQVTMEQAMERIVSRKNLLFA